MCQIHPRIYVKSMYNYNPFWAASSVSLFTSSFLSFWISILHVLKWERTFEVDLRQQVPGWCRCQEVSPWMNASKCPNRSTHWHGVSQKSACSSLGESINQSINQSSLSFFWIGMIDDDEMQIWHEHIPRDPLTKWKGTSCSCISI